MAVPGINTRKIAKSMGYLAAGAAVAGAAYSLFQYYTSAGDVECLVDEGAITVGLIRHNADSWNPMPPHPNPTNVIGFVGSLQTEYCLCATNGHYDGQTRYCFSTASGDCAR